MIRLSKSTAYPGSELTRVYCNINAFEKLKIHQKTNRLKHLKTNLLPKPDFWGSFAIFSNPRENAESIPTTTAKMFKSLSHILT